MMTLIRFWYESAMLAAVNEWKVVNLIVPAMLLQIPTNPRRICLNVFVAMRAFDCDGAFMQIKEEKAEYSNNGDYISN